MDFVAHTIQGQSYNQFNKQIVNLEFHASQLNGRIKIQWAKCQLRQLILVYSY